MNMGHCRFQNTLEELIECHEHMLYGDLNNLSTEEAGALSRLVELCKEIAIESAMGGQ